MSEVNILLLEDSALDADLIRQHLLKTGIAHTVERVDCRDDFTRAVESGRHHLILADHSLPSFDGMTALSIAREVAPATPFIFVSGTLGEELAIESLKKGATDYVVKQRLHRLPAAVTRALDEAAERRERRRAEERQKLLVAELSHRVKNTLATVSTIAQQTLQRSQTLEAFDAAFSGRLRALAEVHALLLQTSWETASLRALVEHALAPFMRTDGLNIDLRGPDVLLQPQAALTLSLILHELATNAVKYGALGSPSGRVEIHWDTDQANRYPHLLFTWTERDGPPVEPPSSQGFGSALIERSIAYELDGEATLFFERTGVVCRINFPLRDEAGPLGAP